MSSRKNSLKRKSFFALLLVFFPAIILILVGSRSCDHKFKELDDYGKIKPYSFIDVNGKKNSDQDFKNTIVIFTVLQESCPFDCSLSFWPLERHIYQQIRKNRKKLNQVRLISFVVDKDGKPVKDLSNMENILKDNVLKYDANLWILASGDPKSIYDIKHNNINLLETGKNSHKKNSYQDLILLVDKKSHLRMALNGNAKDPESEGMIRRMKQSLGLLLKQYDKEKHSEGKK